MFKIVFLTTLITFAFGSYVDKYVGEYVIAATFPEYAGAQSCDKYTFSIVNTVDCKCLQRSDFKLLEFGMPNNQAKIDLAIIDVTGITNIKRMLDTPSCNCGGIMYKNLIVRHIDDNFFAYYESYNNYLKNETLVNVFSKTSPTKESLDAAIKTVPDLKERKYKVICSV